MDGDLIVEETTDPIEISESGLYSIQLVNGSCLSPIYDFTELVVINIEQPTIEWDENAYLRATPGYESYIWYDNGVEFATTPEDSLFFFANGLISVAVIDQNGCLSERSEEIEVIVSNTDDLAINTFNLSPNPFDNNLLIELSFKQQANSSIKLISADGKLIETRTLDHSKDHKINFDTSGLSTGIYFVQVLNQGKVYTKMLSKL